MMQQGVDPGAGEVTNLPLSRRSRVEMADRRPGTMQPEDARIVSRRHSAHPSAQEPSWESSLPHNLPFA